ALREVVLQMTPNFLLSPSAPARLQFALTVGELDGADKFDALARVSRDLLDLRTPEVETLAARESDRQWMQRTILSGLRDRPWRYMQAVVEHSSPPLNFDDPQQADFVEQVVALVGASHAASDLNEMMSWWMNSALADSGRIVVMAGVAAGMDRSSGA